MFDLTSLIAGSEAHFRYPCSSLILFSYSHSDPIVELLHVGFAVMLAGILLESLQSSSLKERASTLNVQLRPLGMAEVGSGGRDQPLETPHVRPFLLFVDTTNS